MGLRVVAYLVKEEESRLLELRRLGSSRLWCAQLWSAVLTLHLSWSRLVGRSGLLGDRQNLSVAPPAEPRGEKKLVFVQILGGEKLLKFGEKWAVKNF